jgi:hypothetical protein
MNIYNLIGYITVPSEEDEGSSTSLLLAILARNYDYLRRLR